MNSVFKERREDIQAILKECEKIMSETNDIMRNIDNIEKERELSMAEKESWMEANSKYNQADKDFSHYYARLQELDVIEYKIKELQETNKTKAKTR